MLKKDFQKMARDLGLRGWSRMSKSELEVFLQNNLFGPPNLMDEPIPEIGVPVLTPTQAPPERITEAPEEGGDWLKWVQWLESEPEPPPKPVKEWLLKLRDEYRSSAMSGFYQEMVIRGRKDELPRDFFRRVRPQIGNLLRQNNLTKVKLMLTCVLSKTDLNSGEYLEFTPTFLSKNKVNLAGTNKWEIVDEMWEEVMVNMANYQREGSNLQFEEIIELVIPFARYVPLRGSSYIPTPQKLAVKKAIVNLKNDDEECFKWCVTRALNPVESHPERITEDLRRQSIKYDWSGLSFPVTFDQIEKFERRNPGIAVHVFGYENEEVFPLRKPKVVGIAVDLLFLTQRVNPQEQAVVREETLEFTVPRKTHYCWIKNLNRLLGGQVTKHEKHVVFCRNCLNHFPEDRLKIHEESCLSSEAVKIEMPGKGAVMKFKNYHRKMQHPFVIYADFEARLKKIKVCEDKPKGSYTHKIQEHIPVSFAFHVVSEHVKKKPVLYRASCNEEDVGKKFVEVLSEFVKEIQNTFKNPVPMQFGRKERDEFNQATHCWICEKEFIEDDKESEKKVRDHCHFTGKFRGAAHTICNLNFRKPKFTPVFIHNLKGYDSHFIVKALGEVQGNVKCIANTEEKYISFSKTIELRKEVRDGKPKAITHEIRFLDSAGFMQDSLANLVQNLRDEDFHQTKKVFKKKWELFKRKGVFPYEWLDSAEKFNESRLPEKEDFYSKLSGGGISEEEHEHAIKVWNEMGMKNMGEYHDAYLKADVTELADVIEEFRKVCQKEYALDPVWYYTTPGLAWDAALKKSGVELELLSDIEMMLFFERGIRGGVSTITHRRAQANNKYMKNFDKSKPSVFCPYWDANGLYSWAMLHPLPVGKFKWMSEVKLKNWEEIPCVLEVDVDIPEELHDKFNDYPPLPEKVKVGGNVSKLIPNLWNKRKMIVHNKILKQALSLGCKLVKVWRGLEFEEKAWLKTFIETNSSLRQKAKNTFEKNFFKLMNNAVFGKTMENVKKRREIQLVHDVKKYSKLVAKPSYDHTTRFNEKIVGVHMKKTKIVFDKPIYVGQAILDISKTCMYEFHYEYVKKKWPEAKLCFTDTDSLLYRIETEDLFEDIAGDVAERFDTSEFASDHEKVVDGTIVRMNKKVPGLMKDETCGKQIIDFVGLRPKCYSLKVDEGGGTKKCKGVKKSVVKKRMAHEDWVRCVEDQKPQMQEMVCIRSQKHSVSTVVVNKIALSANDDKRKLMCDGVSTQALGYKGEVRECEKEVKRYEKRERQPERAQRESEKMTQEQLIFKMMDMR